MVWVYSDPLTPNEVKTRTYIEKTFKKQRYSEKIIKLLSLLKYLKSKKYNNAKQLQNDIFIKEGKLLFDTPTAQKIYKSLKTQRGGDNDYKLTNSVLESAGTYLKNNDPTGLSWVFGNGLWILTLPVKTIKGIVGEGVYDVASESVHGIIETSVSGVNGVAETAGGPIGFAVVGLFTGIAAAAGAALAVSEGDFAQAAVHAITFIPGVGPALARTVNKVESVSDEIQENKENIEKYPFGETLVSLTAVPPESTGGRRKTKRKKRKL
jgi:hypothetical protein